MPSTAATRPEPVGGRSDRRLRADARRNRERILEVAFESFASEGLAVPVQEIARRARVGTGTVSRHFPTKESLFEAILVSRIERLAAEARGLGASRDPARAFIDFFSMLVAEGAANRGMADALTGSGYDLDALARRSELDLMGGLQVLLSRAQKAEALRPEIDVRDVKALLAGCLAREVTGRDPGARERLIAVVAQGLRLHPS